MPVVTSLDISAGLTEDQKEFQSLALNFANNEVDNLFFVQEISNVLIYETTQNGKVCDAFIFYSYFMRVFILLELADFMVAYFL